MALARSRYGANAANNIANILRYSSKRHSSLYLFRELLPFHRHTSRNLHSKHDLMNFRRVYYRQEIRSASTAIGNGESDGGRPTASGGDVGGEGQGWSNKRRQHLVALAGGAALGALGKICFERSSLGCS